MKKKQDNRKERIEIAKLYVKQNIWKRILKYKIYEFGIIPLVLIILWKVPIWIGWWAVKLLHINLYTNTFFCKNIGTSQEVVCDGVNYYLGAVWSIGALICFIIAVFILFNWKLAKTNLEDEASTKFDVYSSEIN
jgi:hypothetical protein